MISPPGETTERGCGNVDFGTTSYEIRRISTNMLITSIRIR